MKELIKFMAKIFRGTPKNLAGRENQKIKLTNDKVMNIGVHNRDAGRLKKLTTRISVELYRDLSTIAASDDRSVTYVVNKMLEKCVSAYRHQKNFDARCAHLDEENRHDD